VPLRKGRVTEVLSFSRAQHTRGAFPLYLVGGMLASGRAIGKMSKQKTDASGMGPLFTGSPDQIKLVTGKCLFRFKGDPWKWENCC